MKTSTKPAKTSKINLSHIIKVVLFVVLLIGITMIFAEVSDERNSLEEQVFSNNQEISGEYQRQISLMKNYLKLNAGLMRYNSIEYDTTFSNNRFFINENEDNWTGVYYSESGDKVYTLGSEIFDDNNLSLIRDLNLVGYFIDEINLTSISEVETFFIYHNSRYKFDVFYPMGDMKFDYTIKNMDDEQLITDFARIDKTVGSSKLVNDHVFIWQTIDRGNVIDPVGFGIRSFRDLDLNNFMSDAVYLFVEGDPYTIIDNEMADIPKDKEFFSYDNDLHKKEDDKNIYYYRTLTDGIVYVSRTNIRALTLEAIVRNYSFILMVIVIIGLLYLAYLYMVRYRKYVDLELESKEQELKKTVYKSRLGYVMNTISEAFVRTDNQEEIIEVNQATADMLGYQTSELLGRFMSEFIDTPISVSKYRSEGLHTRYEISLKKKDGTILYGLVNQSTIFIDESNEKEHYILITDITPMMEAQQRAEEANKSKSKFIANLSHEIRTPMNASIGYIYLLEQTNLTDIQRKYLEKMDYAANTLLEIIDEILDFSKIEADRVSIENISFDLHKVVQNAMSMFENTAYRNEIKYEVHIDNMVPVNVLGDPYRFRQILINLLSNAFKFTSFGGVTITVSLVDNRYKYGYQDDVRLRVIIEDTGIGIAEERMEILFDPFVQADETTTRLYGGTGLGLAICKRLVGLMNGRIYAKSKIGVGSSFFVEIPCKIAYASVMENEKVENPKIVNKLSNKKILIVEDNLLNQELLIELLVQNGNRVIVANNGKVAEEILLKDHKPAFDLILMDIQMPVQDGYTTAKFIRSYEPYKKVPIIAVTANADQDTQVRIADTGMNDYILKPINAADLYSKIGIWK